jgi:galactosamine-6-phosphate isomerase
VHIQIARDHDEMSRKAAILIARALRQKPGLALGLATGATPTRTYERLAQRRRRQPALFRGVRVVKLDEWLGLPLDHPATCETYLREQVLGPWGVPRSRYLGFHSRPRHPRAECARVARGLARRGRLDLCVLGLGRNGHLLMNEPAPALAAGPHVARLAPSTRAHSMVRALKAPPRRGLTMGMADILRSRAILVLVSGREKTAPLRRMMSGAVTTRCPASLLWLHPDVTVLCDREAWPLRRRMKR